MISTNKFALAVILMGASALSAAANLTIAVDGVQSADGQVLVALYNSAGTFLGKPMRAVAVPAAVGKVKLEVKDLPEGDYAFALYHDANGNQTLDKNMIGMPSEDYAFSNDAMGRRGPPTFEAARFRVPAAGATVAINLR